METAFRANSSGARNRALALLGFAQAATKSLAKLMEFVEQRLHCVKQCEQGVLGNVPNRAHVDGGVA